MSIRTRAALISGIAALGLGLGAGTASAQDVGDGPSGQGNPIEPVVTTVQEVVGKLAPPILGELIGGLYG